MPEPVIHVEHLSKRYRIGRKQGARQVNQNLLGRVSAPFHSLSGKLRTPGEDETIWALKDVSFEVQQGEVLGVIGRNGAGKSTLLKILSRITEPTSGRAVINGRVGSLLEVGTGFHPELTGRENIYLNGAILGMRKWEIDRKFDEIVDFAEVEKFLDTPVKRYSSGMYVRLAFSVAAHLEPEILFVDEVLAVGDSEFQKKCLGKIGDVSKAGRTVLFVSHNMGAIRTLCERVILLEDGVMMLDDFAELVIGSYLIEKNGNNSKWRRVTPLPSEKGIYFLLIEIMNHQGINTSIIDSTKSFIIRIKIQANSDFFNAQIAIRLTNQEGIPIFTTANTDQKANFEPIAEGIHDYSIEVSDNFLKPGIYSLIIASMIPGMERFDMVENKLIIRIEDTWGHSTIIKDGRLGVVTPIFKWKENEIFDN